MASSVSNKKTKNTNRILPAAAVEKIPPIQKTTYIETDATSFKAVVQKFTAVCEKKPPTTTHKTPPTAPPRPAEKEAVKLKERRQSGRIQEIKLKNNGGGGAGGNGSSSSSSSGLPARPRRIFGFNCEKVMVSPVSPLEVLARGESPRTPTTPCSSPLDEEMRCIHEKGYYIHPTSAIPSRVKPPQLLPLFPIHLARDDDHHDVENQDSSSSTS